MRLVPHLTLVLLAGAAIGLTVRVTAASSPLITAGESVHQGPISITAAPDGRFQINIGRNHYIVSSGFSYPGRHIGWDTFAAARGSDQPGWSPVIRRTTPNALTITAQGSDYRIQRQIMLAGNKIRIIDRLTNIGPAPAGIFIRNSLATSNVFLQTIIPGGPANPTLYLRDKHQVLGIAVKDVLGRLMMHASAGHTRARLSFGDVMPTLALAPGESYSFHWTIYLLPIKSSYFDFINLLRRDWHCNFPVHGPWAPFNFGNKVVGPLLKDPNKLRAWIVHHGVQSGYVLLGPWVGYDAQCYCDAGWSRKEYLDHMRPVIQAFRKADPKVKLLGALETDLVTFDPRKLKGGSAFKNFNATSVELTGALARVIKNAHLPWMDSMQYTRSGHIRVSMGRCAQVRPRFRFWVYPAPGNYQEKHMLNEIHFLLDKVGMDGVYVDDFSQAYGNPPCSFHGWDRHTAYVDPNTGKIRKLTVDLSYVGARARLKIIHAVLDQGKVMVANTWATTAAEQALPVMRFAETFWYYKPGIYPDGIAPPRLKVLLRGNLTSLINYGVPGIDGPLGKESARDFMKGIIAGLRNGTPLFYPMMTPMVVSAGVCNVESRVLRRMYPITPVALHKGWIQGRQRIITCVSGQYRWTEKNKPVVFLFDLHGRPIHPSFKLRRTAYGWNIALIMKNWDQLAIIEKPHD